MTEDGKLASLVVRNIGDIEAAYHLACQDMSDRLLCELYDMSEITIPKSWTISGERGDCFSIFPLSWNKNYGENGDDLDFWLAIDEDYHENNEDGIIEHSWIAVATGSEPLPSQLALWFNFNHRSFISEAKFKKVMQRERKLLDCLHAYGFKIHTSGKYILMPISIDLEELALAYEQDDFDRALFPVKSAIERSISAESQIKILIDMIMTESQK